MIKFLKSHHKFITLKNGKNKKVEGTAQTFVYPLLGYLGLTLSCPVHLNHEILILYTQFQSFYKNIKYTYIQI